MNEEALPKHAGMALRKPEDRVETEMLDLQGQEEGLSTYTAVAKK